MSVRILNGDCRKVLATLSAESVHCCVTSPPYWGLRDYGVAGQIGLESTYQEFVEQMVAVFREVRRVLRKDGTLWLNFGDSYAGSFGAQSKREAEGIQALNLSRFGAGKSLTRKPEAFGLKPKDLCGIPWRVAFALQADGWWLRQDIIWSKPNPMPESVTDRCTKAHEYLFLMTKAERYFYDSEAIREDFSAPPKTPGGYAPEKATGPNYRGGHSQWEKNRTKEQSQPNPSGRNRRSVWEVATAPFSEAHFATFPPALIEPCILAGTSAKGCCAKCGAPWVRKTNVSYDNPGNRTTNGPRSTENRAFAPGFEQRLEKRTETMGWSPSCTCNAAVVPATVLDPFGGAGTTGLVADRLQRDAILIELNPQYAAMAQKRIHGDAPLFAEMTAP